MDGGLVVPTTRQYALSVIRKPVCSAVEVFVASQVPPDSQEAFDPTNPPGAPATRYPAKTISRRHKNTQHDRVLLCRDAFTAYCGTALYSATQPTCFDTSAKSLPAVELFRTRFTALLLTLLPYILLLTSCFGTAHYSLLTAVLLTAVLARSRRSQPLSPVSASYPHTRSMKKQSKATI
jgi:hypothetical protein